MIVKIKNDNKKPTQNWVYCDGDTIVPTKGKSTPRSLVDIYSNDTLFLLCTTGIDFEKDEINYLHLNVSKNNQVVKRIVTNQRTYLMNDDGKTVDKLF